MFGNQEGHYIDTIKQMLLTSLQDNSSYDVRFAAVKATCIYLLSRAKDANVPKHFGELWLPVLTVS